MKQITLGMNSGNMLQALKLSFTNSTTVLGELLQNARRAGATQINVFYDEDSNTLRVSDNGIGIASFDALLIIGESDWSDEVTNVDKPFGIGFLSAIFACEHLTVTSKCGTIRTDTADLVNLKSITIDSIETVQQGTEIKLSNINFCQSSVGQNYHSVNQHLRDTLTILASGFPTLINYEHELLPNLKSSECSVPTKFGELGYLKWYDTRIGKVGLSITCIEGSYCYDDIAVYLQGLPIYQPQRYHRSFPHIVHLDSSMYTARLPDRDKLIDEDTVIAEVLNVLQETIKVYCLELVAGKQYEKLCDLYRIILNVNCLEVYNEVPMLPKYTVCTKGYPTSDNDIFDSFGPTLHDHIPQSAVSNKVYKDSSDAVWDRDYNKEMYIYSQSDALVLTRPLDEGHWIWEKVIDLEEAVFSTEVVGETTRVHFIGIYSVAMVVFCEAYKIHMTCGELTDCVTVENTAMYLGDDNDYVVYMPNGEVSSDVIMQISQYCEEGNFQQSAYEQDQIDFENFLIANRLQDNPAGALCALLPTLNNCPVINNRTFAISFNNNGIASDIKLMDKSAEPFISESAKLVYILLESDGKLRQKALCETEALYGSKKKATLWKSDIEKRITIDTPNRQEALAKLDSIYQVMVTR